jgi:hypothetical protein
MRRILMFMAVMAAMVAAAALPAFAEGKPPPNSCGVGSPVSLAADRTRGLGLGGFGKFIHGAGFGNLGNELIQPVFHEPIQEACHLD